VREKDFYGRHYSHRVDCCIIHNRLGIPQLVKNVENKINQRHLNRIFTLFAGGVFLWFVYGVLVGDLPIILANFLAFIQAVIILTFKIKYK